jgi:hypothetical protein
MSAPLPLMFTARTNFSCIGFGTADCRFRRPWGRLRPQPMEAAMERFVHNAKIDLYRRLIAESERNPKRDEDRHKMLLTFCQ